MSLNQDSLFTHKIHVRIDDINFANHLCHSKFISLIHHTRALFLKKYHLSESSCFGCGLVMLSLNIDYLSQCFFDDFLEISLNIDKVENVKFTLSYSVFNQTSQKLAAKATTVMGFIDIHRAKIKRIPVEFSTLVDNVKKNKE